MRFLIDCYNRAFKKKTLSDVFTPGTVAKVNYLRRGELEARITNSLETPGVQIILYGHSGSGKTTVIRKLLDENNYQFVRTQCTKEKTLNDVILDAFSQLDRFCVSEWTFKKGRKIGSTIKAEIESIKAEIGCKVESSSEQKMTRLLPPRLTAQKLAEIFRESGLIWMIEDFHKLSDVEKQKLIVFKKPNILVQKLGVFPDCLRLVQSCLLVRPVKPSLHAEMPLERHEQGVVGQPRAIIAHEPFKLRLISLDPTSGGDF